MNLFGVILVCTLSLGSFNIMSSESIVTCNLEGDSYKFKNSLLTKLSCVLLKNLVRSISAANNKEN